MPSASILQQALQAARLGKVEALQAAISQDADIVTQQDAVGKTCLHWAAGYGHSECIDVLLAQPSVQTDIQDNNGDCALHCAASDNQPMSAYSIANVSPADCLASNHEGQTPVDIAVEGERGEVLNAMLLACASDRSESDTGPPVALKAMRTLLEAGAVADTWAPNGSSALMLAASADSTDAVALLLEKGATLELQDALGRSAMMFAAGNNAPKALTALIEAGGSVSQRDKRGRQVLDYAADATLCHEMLKARHKALQEEADKHQAALLAELDAKETACQQKAKKKKRKKGKKKDAGAAEADEHPDDEHPDSANQDEEQHTDDQECSGSPSNQQTSALQQPPQQPPKVEAASSPNPHKDIAGESASGGTAELCKPAADGGKPEECSTSGRIKAYQDGKRGLGLPFRIIEITADASIPTTGENSPESCSPEHSPAGEGVCSIKAGERNCSTTAAEGDCSVANGHSRRASLASAVNNDYLTVAEGGSASHFGQSEEGCAELPADDQQNSGAASELGCNSRQAPEPSRQGHGCTKSNGADQEPTTAGNNVVDKASSAIVAKVQTEEVLGDTAGADWQVVKPPRKAASKGKPPLAGPRPDKVQEHTGYMKASTSSASLESLADSMSSLESRGQPVFSRSAQISASRTPPMSEQAAAEASERAAARSAAQQSSKATPEFPATSAAKVSKGNGTWADRVAGKDRVSAPSPSHSATELAGMARSSSADTIQAPFLPGHMAWEADSRASSEGLQPTTPPSAEGQHGETQQGAELGSQTRDQHGYQLFSSGIPQLWAPRPKVSEWELALQRELAGKDQEVQQLQLALEHAQAELAKAATSHTRALQRAREQGYQAGQAQLLANIHKLQFQPQPAAGSMSSLLGLPNTSLMGQGTNFLPPRDAAAQLGGPILFQQQAVPLPARGGSPVFNQQPGALLRHHVGFRGPGGPTARAAALQRPQRDDASVAGQLFATSSRITSAGGQGSIFQQAGSAELPSLPLCQGTESASLHTRPSRQQSASSTGLSGLPLLAAESANLASRQQSIASAASLGLTGLFAQHQRAEPMGTVGVTGTSSSNGAEQGSGRTVGPAGASLVQGLQEVSLARASSSDRVKAMLPNSTRDLLAGLEQEFLRGDDSATAFCTPAALD